MVKKTYLKTVIRCFLHNKARFLANLFIVFLSVILSCGLLALPSTFKDSYAKNYSDLNAPDLIVKTKVSDGLNNDAISGLKENPDVESVLTMMAYDYESDDGKIYRLYIYDFDENANINSFKLIDGNYPDESKQFSFYDTNEVIAEKGNKNRTKYQLGDTITIDLSSLMSTSSKLNIPDLTLKVSGIVETPLYASVQEEEPWLENNHDEKKVDSILYINKKLIPSSMYIKITNYISIPFVTTSYIKTTDIFVRYKCNHNYFTTSYHDEMYRRKDELLDSFGKDNVSVLTLKENISYATFDSYNEKINKIALVFPSFFLLLSALVNLITMTRLIDDERKLIGCYVSLGISKEKIYVKYLAFTFISTLLGLIGGYFFGIFMIPNVVYSAYTALFKMNGVNINYCQPMGWIVCALMMFVTLLVTFISAKSRLNENPASLMKAKAPKAGKKILLEHITFFWKPLPFKIKSSLRNIYRQKKNLILTTLSIVGSTLLCLLGFGLLDISNSLLNDPLFSDVASSMGTISTVIILFALMMTVVVVYSLTNMNIQERERELATLKVLGYHDIECSFYTFREMLIITIVACLIGLPVSYGIMYFVFDYLNFGSANDVKAQSYIYTFLIIVISTIIVNFMLYPKVKKINQNESLKSVE